MIHFVTSDFPVPMPTAIELAGAALDDVINGIYDDPLEAAADLILARADVQACGGPGATEMASRLTEEARRLCGAVAS